MEQEGEMTQLLIKRSIRKLQVGDVLVRHTGERCRILDITHDTNSVGGKTVRYRFFGFDALYPAMRRMFDLSDDVAGEYVPNISMSYAAANGQAAAAKGT